MKTLIITLAILLAACAIAQTPAAKPAPADATKPVTNSCPVCHKDLDAKNAAIVAGYRKDIHSDRGLLCSDCHGGDPTVADQDAMDPAKGFVGAPERNKIPEFCAKCHSNPVYMRRFNPVIRVDQLEKYRTSQRGILLAKGDVKTAVCISCHGVHGILAADDPSSPVYKLNVPETCNKCHGNERLMASYGIPTNQYDNFRAGVHGIALLEKRLNGAPACNDCHGNHGAVPPGITDIGSVCGTCHSFNNELFEQSPHKDAFKKAGFKQCEQCHGYHKIDHPTDDMLGVQKGAVCGNCHSTGEAGYVAAARMKVLLDSLISTSAKAKLDLAAASALDMDVADGETMLEAVRENLIESRTAIHAFSDKHLAEVEGKGFAAASGADSIAMAAIYDYHFRRRGFLIATLIITGTALLLWLKIRQIERRRKTAVR